MTEFFSKTHEQFPVEENEALKFCKGTVKRISFSGLTNYESCNYHLFLDKVSNIPGVSTAPAARGNVLHEGLELYVNGTNKDMDWKAMKSKVYHKQLIDAFKEDYANGLCIPELKFAITDKLKKTKWDAANVWLRGAIDVVIFETNKKERAAIYDYKSGRSTATAKHRSQLLLYVLMMFMMYPKLKHIRAAPIYLDQNESLFYTEYHRLDFDRFWPRYLQRLQAPTTAEYFPPNPNAFSCRWCQHKITQTDLGQTEPACKFAHVG